MFFYMLSVHLCASDFGNLTLYVATQAAFLEQTIYPIIQPNKRHQNNAYLIEAGAEKKYRTKCFPTMPLKGGSLEFYSVETESREQW